MPFSKDWRWHKLDVFNLTAKIGLDTSEYTDALNDASNETNSASTSISAKAVAIGNAIYDMGKKAASALIGFAKDSIQTGMDFDSAMSQVAATMGYTTAELNDSTSEASQNMQTLRDFAMEMGSTTAFSATQAADALNYMALAGYDTEQSMSMLPNVLNLAAAGSMDLAAASDMITDSQTALGLTFEQTNTLVDQMAATASNTNTSVAQLGDAILTVGGNAKELSGGTDELNAVLGILADNGIKGAEAGTHLRNIMLAMNPTTDAAAAAFEQLGIEAYDSEGNLRSLDSIFMDLSASMDGMTSEEKTDIINKIFNKTDLAAVNALLNTNADRWDEVYDAIENAEGAAQAMADVQLDNLEGDITLFKSALEGAQIELADKLEPALRTVVQAVTDFVSNGGIGNLIDGFLDLAPAITTVVTAFVSYKAAMGISGIIQTLTAATQGQTIAQTLLNAVMNANPFAIVASVVAALVAGIVVLWNTNEGFRDAVTQIWEQIKQLFSDALAAIQSVWESVGPFFSDLWLSIQDTFSVVSEVLGGFFSDAWQSIQNTWSVVTGWFSNIWQSIQSTFSVVSSVLGSYFQSAWSAIQAIWSVVGGYFSQIWETIKGIFSVVSSVLSGNFSDAWAAIQGVVSGWTAYFSNIWQSIRNVFSNAVSVFSSIGANIVAGIKQGISNAWSALVSWFQSKIQGLVNGVKSALGIASPSKVFAGIGGFMAEGLGVGWGREFSAVERAIEGDMDFSGIGPDISASLSGGVYGNGAGGTSNSYGGMVVNINITGAEYDDADSLAETIAQRIQDMTNRRQAVYA